MESRFNRYVDLSTKDGQRVFAFAVTEYQRIFKKDPPGDGVTRERYDEIAEAIEAEESPFRNTPAPPAE